MVKSGMRVGHSPWADDEPVKCERGNHSNAVQIIYDPDEIGGFSRGAELDHESLRVMLIARMFTPGTRLCYPLHGEMQVVDYTYHVARGTAIFFKQVQALKGDCYYLLPNCDTGKKSFIRIGQHGQRAAGVTELLPHGKK